MKIKTFEFFVSNIQSFHKAFGSSGYEERTDKPFVPSFEEIDNTINDFIADKDVIDIKVNDFKIHQHNNAMGDTIKRTYTIIYK